MFITGNELIWDKNHNLLYCRNAKVGSTSWLTIFLLLSEYRELYLNGTIYTEELQSKYLGYRQL